MTTSSAVQVLLTKREQHPTCFSTITLDLVLKSPNTIDADFEKAIGLADEKL